MVGNGSCEVALRTSCPTGAVEKNSPFYADLTAGLVLALEAGRRTVDADVADVEGPVRTVLQTLTTIE